MKTKLLVCFVAVIAFVNSVSGSVGLIMPDVSGDSGTQVTVPVTVTNFNLIISTQGTIVFDTSVVSFASIQDYGLTGMNSSCFGTTQINDGIITFSWYDGTLAGVTLVDSSVIFSVTFNIIGNKGAHGNLNFENSPTTLEIVNSTYVIETIDTVNGSVDVNSAPMTINEHGNVGIDGNYSEIYPNPFDLYTQIVFCLPFSQFVNAMIYNNDGVLVKHIYGYYPEGKNIITWDARSDYEEELSNGIYFIKIQTETGIIVNKMLLAK